MGKLNEIVIMFLRFVLVVIPALLISSCSNPKSDLEAQRKAAMSELASLVDQSKKLTVNIEAATHKQQLIKLEFEKIAQQQSISDITLMLRGGLGVHIGDAPSIGDAGNYINSKQDAQIDIKMLKINYDKLESDKTQLMSTRNGVLRNIKKKKKQIRIMDKMLSKM